MRKKHFRECVGKISNNNVSVKQSKRTKYAQYDYQELYDAFNDMQESEASEEDEFEVDIQVPNQVELKQDNKNFVYLSIR